MQRAIHLCTSGLIVFACALARPRAGVGDESPVDQRLLRVQQWIQSGDLSSAKNELQELRARPHQSDPRIYNLLGVIDAQQNDLQAAESNFRQAIQLAPRFTGAYLNLGHLLQEHSGEAERTGKALEVYLKILAFDPTHVEANYQAASLLNRLGRFNSSLAHLDRLPADARQRAAALALRCSNHVALGSRVQAQAAFHQLSEASDLTEADILPILPVLHAHSADELARALLETLAARGLISNVGWQALAGLEEKQGRFKEARDSLEKDLQLEPPSAPLLVRLAKLAYQSADLDGALGYLAHARDLDPQNAAIHFFFGLVCVDLKLPPEAKRSLVEAVRLDPDNPQYHYALGAVLLAEKKADEAIPHFLKYAAVHPDDARGKFALGVAYFDAYRPDAARTEFTAAAVRPETRAGANLYLGRLAVRAGNFTEAEDLFRKAAAANPSSPEPLAELSLIQIDREAFALAEGSLNKALQVAPNHYRTNLNLLMLYQRTKDPRAEQQAKRVKELEKASDEKEIMLLRSLEIRP
jgi:Flp pilus assembly protein TadD